MLERDAAESNGNVRRMCAVCSEFERIARVVLDKAERDMRGGRGKRKQAEREREKDKKDTNSIAAGLEEGKTIEQMQVETQSSYRRPVQTPSLRASLGASSSHGSPASWVASPAGGTGSEYRTPNTAATSIESAYPQPNQPNTGQMYPPPTTSAPGFSTPNGNFPQQDFATTAADFSAPISTDGSFNPATTAPGFLDMNNQFTNSPDMANGQGSFQQPFVPQDLWQMPMTLEWDWAEGLGLGSFTPGPMFDGYGFVGDGIDVAQPHQPGPDRFS